MASNFPTSLDSFTNPLSGDKLDSPSHSTQHADANDAIEGLETKIGIGASPAGSATAGYAFVHSSGGTTAWSQVGVTGLSSGTAVANTVLTANGSGATTFAPTAQGLTLLIPSSVAVGSGTGTVSATGTVTFSGASSVSINDVFSATYDNYFIVTNITTASATGDIQLRMRVAGADNSSSNYYNAFVVTAVSGAASAVALNDSGLTTVFKIGYYNSGDASSNATTLFSPFKTAKTQYHRNASVNLSTDTTIGGGGNMSVTTSYTGFTLIAGAGNMTGNVSVYGYNK